MYLSDPGPGGLYEWGPWLRRGSKKRNPASTNQPTFLPRLDAKGDHCTARWEKQLRLFPRTRPAIDHVDDTLSTDGHRLDIQRAPWWTK